MVKKLLLLSFILLLMVSLFAQKRSSKTKVVHPKPLVAIKSHANLTFFRELRLKQREEAERSIVVLKNSKDLLPLARLDTLKILVVGVG